MEDTYDYVIVGAGSAGCVLANRLTEDPNTSVLLLEAGGVDPFWEWKIRMPAALAYPMNGKRYNWDYHTEPEPHLDGRVMHCPRGKVLGGSSSINGMVYIRGNALDYDRWASEDASLKDWDYQHCLPYFIKAESREGGGDDYHGNDGPLRVARGRGENPLCGAFTKAAEEAGYPYTPDMNGYQQEGFGPMDRTTGDGIRHSTAVGYLRPCNGTGKPDGPDPSKRTPPGAAGRNLRMTRDWTLTHKGQARKGASRAKTSSCPVARSTAPKLLMLSGIGPGRIIIRESRAFRSHTALAGCRSRNLQDHLEIYLQMACTQPVSLFKYYNLLGKAYVGARWLLTRTGLGASNSFEAGGFIRSRAPASKHPDIQYHFFPMAVRYDGKSPNNSHGFQAHVGPMRSRSKGSVKLRSADPEDDPRIRFNYMSQSEDWAEFRAAIRHTREIFAQAALAPYSGVELSPGPEVQSDEELDTFLEALWSRHTTRPAPARWEAMRWPSSTVVARSGVLTDCVLSITPRPHGRMMAYHRVMIG